MPWSVLPSVLFMNYSLQHFILHSLGRISLRMQIKNYFYIVLRKISFVLMLLELKIRKKFAKDQARMPHEDIV